jgi:hypothetical protein
MRFISPLKRVLTSPSPNSPPCPRCHTEMVPVGNWAPVAALRLAAGGNANHPIELAVWFCENCGERRPRFGPMTQAPTSGPHVRPPGFHRL